MKVTPEIVRHVAAAARLELTETEIKKFSRDMNNILLAFKDIDKVKARIEPSFQPLEIKDVMRDDKPEPCLQQQEALANARHKEAGFFKGPRAV